MMISSVIKLTLFFVVTCLFASLTSASEYQEEYDQINDYLVKTDQEGGKDNMDRLVDWLESMSLFSQIKDRLKRGPNAKIASALKQLVALRNWDKCSYRATENLRRNHLATGGHGRDSQSQRPVDQLVFKYTVEHALHCRPVYETIFAEKRQLLDRQMAERVEYLHKYYLKNVRYGEQFKTEWLANNETDVYQFLVSLNDTKILGEILNISIEPLDISKTIVALAKQFPLGSKLNSILSKDFQSAEFYSYLLKPCDYYNNRMDIFYAAEYEKEILDSNDMGQQQIDASSADYYFGWSKFNLCQHILDNQRDLKQFWLENWDTVAVKGEKPIETPVAELSENEQ